MTNGAMKRGYQPYRQQQCRQSRHVYASPDGPFDLTDMACEWGAGIAGMIPSGIGGGGCECARECRELMVMK